MSAKGIKIAAWISIALNAVALFGMVGAGGEDIGYGIMYALGMAAVSVVSLLGASEWDRQAEKASEREDALKVSLRDAQRLNQPSKPV
jgi:hypothetical protein